MKKTVVPTTVSVAELLVVGVLGLASFYPKQSELVAGRYLAVILS